MATSMNSHFSAFRGYGDLGRKNEILWCSFKLIGRDATTDIRRYVTRTREQEPQSPPIYFLFVMKMMVEMASFSGHFVKESWMVYWERKGKVQMDWRQVRRFVIFFSWMNQQIIFHSFYSTIFKCSPFDLRFEIDKLIGGKHIIDFF